jgi:hypothetical protein
MAGDWIPMRLDLYEDPAVAYMAERLGQREEVVVGFLHRVWAWASRQSQDGCVYCVTMMSMGRVTSLPNFPELMAEAGWLESGTDEVGRPFIRFPNWDRWMGESAKKRLSASRRKQKERVTQMSQEVVTNVTQVCDKSVTNVTRSCDKSVTTVQESREEKKEDSKSESDKSDPPADKPCDGEVVLGEWNQQMGQTCRWTPKRQKAFRERWKSPAWRESWQDAVARAAASDFCRGVNDRGWLADFEWFLKPDTVTKLLEGKYDDRERKAAAGPVTFGQQRQQNTVELLARLKAEDEANGQARIGQEAGK